MARPRGSCLPPISSCWEQLSLGTQSQTRNMPALSAVISGPLSYGPYTSAAMGVSCAICALWHDGEAPNDHSMSTPCLCPLLSAGLCIKTPVTKSVPFGVLGIRMEPWAPAQRESGRRIAVSLIKSSGPTERGEAFAKGDSVVIVLANPSTPEINGIPAMSAL